MPKEIFEPEYLPHYGLRIEIVNNHTKEKVGYTFGVEFREALIPALNQMIEELDRRVV